MQYNAMQCSTVLHMSQLLDSAGGGLIVHLRDTRHVESDWLLSECYEITLNIKSQDVSE
jgi:hypothetical protein